MGRELLETCASPIHLAEREGVGTLHRRVDRARSPPPESESLETNLLTNYLHQSPRVARFPPVQLLGKLQCLPPHVGLGYFQPEFFD